MYKVKVEETKGIKREKMPVSFGLVPPRGEVRDDQAWQVKTEKSEIIPAQWETRERHDDGSVKLVQLIFVCDQLGARRFREFDCIPVEKAATDAGGPSLIHETNKSFEVRGDNVQFTVNRDGLVAELTYRGKQLIGGPTNTTVAGVYQDIPSSHPGLTMESASKRPVEGRLVEEIETVSVVENGPVRAIIEVGGLLVEPLHDSRPFEFTKRFTFYGEIDEIGVHCRLLNRFTPHYLKEWKSELVLKMPETAVVLGDEDREFPWLIDLNLGWSTLQTGWKHSGVELRYPDGISMAVVTDDFGKYRKGLVQLNGIDERMEEVRLGVNRIEPTWHYKGITSHHPIDNLLFLEGQRRASSFSILFSENSAPKRRLDTKDHGVYVRPLARNGGVELPMANVQGSNGRRWDSLKQRVIDRALSFVVDGGEYHGLLAGGRCHLNDVLMEFGVNRSDYAEYLFYEYKRSGNQRLLDVALEYGERYIDVSIFRSRARTEWSGAVRHRYSENKPDRVRSMRGPVFLCALYLETGRKEFKETALEIGDYILRMFPDTFARQGAVCRELAFLYYFTGDERFREKAYEVMAALKSFQLPVGAWYDAFAKDGRPLSVNEATAGVFISESALKPEMSSYNIVGLVDAARYLDVGPYMPMIEKAVDWVYEVQDEEGAWRFPNWNSESQWGHGIFQDVLAMLKGYELLGKQEYLEAADRGIGWAEKVWDATGYIPSVTKISPHKYLEASLTYFYGVEALSMRSEIG